MRKTKESLQFSASDLSNHIHCTHLTHLNYEAVEGNLHKPFSSSRTLELMRERGLAFEKEYLHSLKEAGFTVCEINAQDKNAQTLTWEAIKSGYDYIYQARLENLEWQGWCDFLVKVETKSDLGNWSYEVLDTKLSANTRAGTILQIALYSEMLAKIQGILPEKMHVKNPETQIEYRVSDYISYLRLIKNRLKTAIDEESATYPEFCAHCDICNWWNHCNDKRRNDDHLSFVAGMGNSQIKEVISHGIQTLEQMATASLPLPFKPSKGSKETYIKLREQARLQKEYRDHYQPIFELIERKKQFGFYKLPQPSEGDIYIKFESDPLVEPNGIEYLMGWLCQGEYQHVWIQNANEEKQAFEVLVDFIFEKRKQFPTLHIYHYSASESTALKRLMGKYVTKEAEIDQLLRSESLINLSQIVKQSIRAGIEKYTLRELEVFYQFNRNQDLRVVAMHQSDYKFLLETKKYELITDVLQNPIIEFNKDECFSLKNLQNWLEENRTQLIALGEEIPRPIVEIAEEPESVSEHLSRIEPIFDALMEGIPMEKSERDNHQEARYLLANLLDWYRREEKSFWWEYFRILALPMDEMLEEKTTLTYLRYTGEREDFKRSIIDTYSFPNQETDLKAGLQVKDQDGNSIGEIYEIDEYHNLLKLKKGPKIKDNHPESIIKFERFLTKDKIDNLVQFAEWIVENGFYNDLPDYKVARDLLLNENPNTISNVIDIENTVEKAIDWSLKLNYSYLPIQGPPGAGKSYTASHMIYNLLKSGKKIGVTALSHKVIINLLKKAKEVADENDLKVKILYKSSATDDLDTFWESPKNTAEIEHLLPNYQIIAGTSFMWCHESLRDAVDYLFVDEAGQFALIETVVVSHAAKNLIFLGDHQQLKQPIQGIHPEGTEVSALEHLLKGEKTIPKNRGIFLEKTWRMHPDICLFDSEMFYEGKLLAVDQLKNQKIEGNTELVGSGLFYKSITHSGNTNVAMEEIDYIENLVNNLTKGDVYWVDKEDKKHLVTANDIKIITPYNSNVFELQKRLPNYEIGTVDKFQGQEAPIVIYSMASSTPEDAPRGMDFLYSPNRFNVAVSRAKIAFILVGNPKLFSPNCKSPEEIKLANPFCRYIELSKMI